MLKRGLKRGIKTLLATSPGWALSRLLRPEGTLVLTYHRVGPNSESFPTLELGAFRNQMRWLQSNCTVIAADEIRAPRRPRRAGRPYVLVTFDDGYREYHDHVYPILKNLGVPAVIFLATAFQDEPGRLLWADTLGLAAYRAAPQRLTLPWPPHEQVDLATEQGRQRMIRAAKVHLKELPHGENLKAQEAILEQLGLGQDALACDRQMMTWDEVRAVRGSLTTIGGHSHTHPILARLDRSAAEHEIRTCRERITAELGEAPRQFAYPNGRAHDFSDEIKAILRREGFEVAYSTEEGVNDGATDWMELRRIPALPDMPDFAWALAALTNQAGRY